MERRDVDQGGLLRTWMNNHILPEFSDGTITIDAAIALCCSRLHVPDPRPERDAFIAATAIVYRMTIVTRNVADFSPLDVDIIEPWKAY